MKLTVTMQMSSIEFQVIGMVSYKLYTGGTLVQAGILKKRDNKGRTVNSVESSTCKGPVVVGYGKCELKEDHGWMAGLWESL